MIDAAVVFVAWAVLTCAAIGFATALYRRWEDAHAPREPAGERSHVRILEPVTAPFDWEQDA